MNKNKLIMEQQQVIHRLLFLRSRKLILTKPYGQAGMMTIL